MNWFEPRIRPVLLFAVLTATCWFGWMGWDLSYDVDPRTGLSSGPYESWQVIGCVVSLVVVCVLAARWLTFGMTWLTMPLVFTIAWSISAIRLDDQGLWAVGAILVLIGMALGTPLIAGPARLGWNAQTRRRVRDALHAGRELYRHPPFDP